MFKLSQETIAIATVGLALAGLDYYGRSEARADREAIRAEIHALRTEARADRAENQAAREAIRAEIHALRTEARADRAENQAAREAIRAENRADREAFEKHITRLTQEQSRLTGIVDQIRTAGR